MSSRRQKCADCSMTCDASRIRGLASTDGQLRCVWTGGPSTCTSAEKADSRRDHARFRHQAAWRKALEEEGSATRCRRGPMTSPPTAAARQVAVIMRRWSSFGSRRVVGADGRCPRAPNAILCGLDVESEGTQQVHCALNTVRFLVRRVGRPMQPSPGPNASRPREVASKSLASHKSISCGALRACWASKALVGPSDAQRVSKSERGRNQVRPPGLAIG